MIESMMRQSIVTNVVITSKCQFSCVTGLVRKNASGGVGAFRAPFSEKKSDGWINNATIDCESLLSKPVYLVFTVSFGLWEMASLSSFGLFQTSI